MHEKTLQIPQNIFNRNLNVLKEFYKKKQEHVWFEEPYYTNKVK